MSGDKFCSCLGVKECYCKAFEVVQYRSYAVTRQGSYHLILMHDLNDDVLSMWDAAFCCHTETLRRGHNPCPVSPAPSGLNVV